MPRLEANKLHETLKLQQALLCPEVKRATMSSLWMFWTHEVVGDLPDGWRCVDGCFELDDMLYTAFRKGEVNPRHLDLQGQQEFVEAKKLELSQYFNNLVWEFATKEEGIKAERNGRTISARWVLTWKSTENPDGTTKWKGKARLVLRGFEDPDVLSLQKAAPTASRLSKTFLLTLRWMARMENPMWRCSSSFPERQELHPGARGQAAE